MSRSLAPLKLGTAALMLAAAQPLQAQLFSDRATFLGNAAITTTTNINFDSFVAGTNLTGTMQSGVQLNSPGGGALTVIAAATGVRFPMSASSGLNILSPGGSTKTSQNDDLELIFSTPVRAFGLDVIFDVPDGASYTSATFYDAANVVLGSNPFIPSPVGAPGYQFYGFISGSSNIARVVFDDFDDSADDDNIGYDSFVFSPGVTVVSTVPEPSTWLLMSAGLIATLGAARRRRVR